MLLLLPCLLLQGAALRFLRRKGKAAAVKSGGAEDHAKKKKGRTGKELGYDRSMGAAAAQVQWRAVRQRTEGCASVLVRQQAEGVVPMLQAIVEAQEAAEAVGVLLKNPWGMCVASYSHIGSGFWLTVRPGRCVWGGRPGGVPASAARTRQPVHLRGRQVQVLPRLYCSFPRPACQSWAPTTCLSRCGARRARPTRRATRPTRVRLGCRRLRQLPSAVRAPLAVCSALDPTATCAYTAAPIFCLCATPFCSQTESCKHTKDGTGYHRETGTWRVVYKGSRHALSGGW